MFDGIESRRGARPGSRILLLPPRLSNQPVLLFRPEELGHPDIDPAGEETDR